MINERAIIVALSYVIGFTTAFIAYGVVNEKSHYSNNNQFEANFSTDSLTAVDLAASSFEAFKTDEGLFVAVDGDERIVSARASSEVSRPGFHFDVPYYAVSPNMEFVHYCEQMTEVPTECTHFIYVVETHVVYPVTVDNDGGLVSNTGDMHTHWLDDGRLEVGPYVSTSAGEPWMLGRY